MSDETPTFLSVRDMVSEIREDIRGLRDEFHSHRLNYEAFRSEVVTKAELQALRDLRTATRKYIINAVIALAGLIVTAAGIIMATQ